MYKDPMLQFVTKPREMPVKRDAQERGHDFAEIYADYSREKAEEQSSRCSQCGVPFCQTHCPLHNNIPDWLRMVASGRLKEAYELSQETNSFPEICGRICPQDRLCEGNCVIQQSGHGTVTIGAVEKYITDEAWKNGWVQAIEPPSERRETVGIIGSGPGGLAAADKLRRGGVEVTIYERSDVAGGLLTYGIPSFKLEKEIVERRVKQLVKSGVTFVLNTTVGRDVSFSDLREKHDALLIATGVYRSRDLDLPGSNLDGIVKAIDYLSTSNRRISQNITTLDPSENDSAFGKNVVVIGGGDTAMDCVRTALRQNAKSVKCLYRRDEANMPGSVRETRHAKEEGVDFQWLSSPKAFLGTQNVTGVTLVKMRLGPKDATGRQRPEEIEGSEMSAPADLVIKALGFDPEDLPQLWDQPELEVTRWGTLTADPTTQQTPMKGVYAIGDIVRGASLVVWAIADGRTAADAILHSFDADTAGAKQQNINQNPAHGATDKEARA